MNRAWPEATCVLQKYPPKSCQYFAELASMLASLGVYGAADVVQVW